MINPENNIPIDDQQNNEADDQQSQKDVHSNGFNGTPQTDNTEEPNTDMLNQAYDASEPSYTLNTDDDQKDPES